jgi:hypothetical protein
MRFSVGNKSPSIGLLGGLEMDLVVSLCWLTDLAVYVPPRIRPC